jgi:hypothetical protein
MHSARGSCNEQSAAKEKNEEKGEKNLDKMRAIGVW